MSEVSVNTFSGGLNTDIDPNIIPSNQYVEAKNVKLSGDGSYSGLTNILGTTNVLELISSSGFPSGSSVLGVYKVKGYNENLGGSFVNGLLIFVYNTTKLAVYFHSTGQSVKYLLFEETQVAGYNGVIDVVKYTEDNVDTVYFTDGVNEPRKIKVYIDLGTGASTPQYNDEDVSLLRRATYASIGNPTISSDTGNLLSGSYQFSVRLFNNDDNTHTKWALLTQPIYISESQRSSTSDLNRIRGGIGLYTDKAISLPITITNDESNKYTHYQIAVVENIQAEDSQLASLLSPQDITPSTTSYSYDYDTNRSYGITDLSDLTVDKAAIKTCKTLAIKNNRLFLGNIEYYSLDYDNGDPSASGSVITSDAGETNIDSSVDDEFVSTKKSYMRGEVYRFAISYFDKYYNFSRPKVIDLNGVTDNQISGSIIDIKFPTQQDSLTYSFLDDTTSRTKHLGLNLTIDNHPTWAKGFVILRTDRIKRIEFQSPLVPMMNISGTGAFGDYPTVAKEGDPPSDVNYDNAQPNNPLGTFIPKNFFFTRNRHTSTSSSSGDSSWLYQSVSETVKAVFPENIYDDGLSTEGFSYNNQDVEVVDVAFLKLDYTSYESGPSLPTAGGTAPVGDFIDTSIQGTFYATNNNDYYYGGTGSVPSDPLSSMGFGISKYEFIVEGTEGTTFGTTPICVFSNIDTEGISWGKPPTVQRMAVIELKSSREDVTYYSDSVGGGGSLSPSGGGSIPSGFIEAQGSLTNEYVINKAGFTERSSYVSSIEIVNIVNSNIRDDRYGNSDLQYEFFTTGAYHVFSSAELSDVELGNSEPINIDVWGGDSYTGIYNYKITDGHYALQDDGDATDDLTTKWVRYFEDLSNDPIQMPVQLDNVSQVISIAHESTKRGSVVDLPAYDSTTDVSVGTGVAISGSESSLRIPFSYFYNGNYSTTPDQKIFLTFDDVIDQKDKFRSRIAYSNQRIYQSDEVGFDLFNALDFYDLDEVYGQVNKLILIKDNMLGFQEEGISYIPIEANILETADGNSLSVRSGEIIGTPIIVNSFYGVQSPKSTFRSPTYAYFVDYDNKTIGRVGEGFNVELLSNNTISTDIDNNIGFLRPDDCRIIYNNITQDIYFIMPNNRCYLFNEKFNSFVSNIGVEDTLLGGALLDTDLFVLGEDSSGNLDVWKFDDSSDNNFFDTALVSEVSFIVNKSPFISKVFDNLIVNTSGALDQATASGFTPTAAYNTTSDPSNLDIDSRGEGSLIVKILRDGNNRRIRGARSLINIKWKNPETNAITLSSVATKYRVSKRSI